MRIIAISRQFGSGGREIGEKLAEKLGWDYYDRNIIEKLCEQENLDEEYVRKFFHDGGLDSLAAPNQLGTFSAGEGTHWQFSLLTKQCELLRKIAGIGRDCIIVGRDADVILKEYNPMRVFVCADLSFRLDRCMKREQKKNGKKLTEKQLLRNIRRIDKARQKTRELLTGKDPLDPENFDLMLNSSSWNTSDAVDTLAKLAEIWPGTDTVKQ